MWAAYKNRTEVARLLLEKGANPNITGQVLNLYMLTLHSSLHVSLNPSLFVKHVVVSKHFNDDTPKIIDCCYSKENLTFVVFGLKPGCDSIMFSDDADEAAIYQLPWY